MIQMNRTHLFLTVNTNTRCKAELHLASSNPVPILPIKFHGFTSRINSKGYHSLFPGLISIVLEMVWVPLKCCITCSIGRFFKLKATFPSFKVLPSKKPCFGLL